MGTKIGAVVVGKKPTGLIEFELVSIIPPSQKAEGLGLVVDYRRRLWGRYPGGVNIMMFDFNTGHRDFEAEAEGLSYVFAVSDLDSVGKVTLAFIDGLIRSKTRGKKK